MITLNALTKRYGDTTAVADLSLRIEPGLVTGFLGPNGAGKSTTMRMIMGLDRPTSGSALIHGRPYAAFRHPLREVGALLDARAVHPSRSARARLLAAKAVVTAAVCFAAGLVAGLAGVAALAILIAWSAAALALGLTVLHRRDA